MIRNLLSAFKAAVLCLTRRAAFEVRHIPEIKLDKSKPTVALIIPCFNHVNYTKKAVESFLSDRSPRFNHVLIMMDDASTDDTQSYCLEKAASVENLCYFRYRKNWGVTQTWNDGVYLALRLVKADYIVVSNNDVIMPTGTVETLVRHLRSAPEAGMIGPLTNTPGNQPLQQIRRFLKDYQASDAVENIALTAHALRGGKAVEITYVNGFFFAATRKAFEKNRCWKGYPRPYFFNPLNRHLGNEDEFQLRLRRKGFRILKAEDAFVFHYKDVSMKRGHYETYQPEDGPQRNSAGSREREP